jgi:hypothetical protein
MPTVGVLVHVRLPVGELLSIDLHVRLWLLAFGCRLYFRLLLCGGPLV